MSERLYFTVPPECDNMTALRFLRGKCGLSARMTAKLKREDYGIVMDKKLLRTVDRVKAGSVVSVAIRSESSEIEPSKGELDVIFEDEHFLAVNKPPYMPVHPVKQHQTDTLANIVAYRCEQNGKPFVFRAINRLDRNTSGLVLIAKNRYCANAVKGSTSKTYLALCEGIISTGGTISEPIGLREDSKIVRAVRPDGQSAVTHYKPLHTYGSITLVELRLETGRTHQIRCHMSSIGYPLAGDDLYGGSLNKISRQALHCAKFEFTHPVTGKLISLFTEMPEDMKALIKAE